jgi:uncharacterized SAM-binding protein YcdF (DUF218 family)
MFFFLSKTLNYLTTPLTLVCAVLVLSLLLRNVVLKKWLRISGILLLLFFSNEFIANEAMRVWEIDPVSYRSMHPYKVGIVLTGAVIPQLQPDDRVYFQRGADRVVHTVQLYKLGLIERILISGGSGRLVDIGEREANQFKDVMLLMGVPDSVIIVENETRNTHESAVEVKKILHAFRYAGGDCLLITSAFHMRRSLACYRKVGLTPHPFTTDFYAHPTVWYFDSFFFPKVEALVIWHKLAREWVGFVAYWLAGYV